MDPYRKVQPGERLKVPARAWNALMGGLAEAPAFKADGVRGPSAPYTFVYCKPSVTVAQWGVLEITGMEITPTGATGPGNSQFESMPVLTGGTPTETSQALCIAIEPIESGKIGRVAVDGAVQCKLDIGNTDHKFARPKASTSEMQTDWGGPALILWKDGATGAGKWGLVRIGTGMPTGVDVVTNATLGPTGIQFEKKRLWAIGVTGVTGSAIGVTGC